MGKFIDSKLYKKVVPKRTQEIIRNVRESAKRRNQVSSSSGGGGNVGVTPVVPPPSTSQGGNLMTGGNVGDPGGIANQFNRPPQIKQPDTMPTYNYDTGKYDPPTRIVYGKEEGIQKSYFDFASNIEETRTTGQGYIDFDSSKPVIINGETIEGKNAQYKVVDFQPRYLYGHDTSEKGRPRTLIASEYDIYLENIGKDMLKNVEGYDPNMLRTTGINALREWHPDTKITKTPEGFKFDFPYAGAEHYGSMYDALIRSGKPGLLATAFTGEDPLGLASAYYTAVGDRQKVIDTKIKAIYSTQNKSFPEFYMTSPMGTIGTTALIATGIGSVSTAATGFTVGRYGAGSAAAWLLKGGEAAIGGALIGLTAADIEKTYRLQGPGEALGKTVVTGLSFGAAYGGYKAGKELKIKGATPYEWTYRKGYEMRIIKSAEKNQLVSAYKTIDGAMKEYKPPNQREMAELYKQYSKQEFTLRRNLRDVPSYEKKIDFSRVQTLKENEGLQEFYSKHLLRRESGIFGSLSEGRTEVHDLDVMYKNYSQGLRESQYASKMFRAGDVKNYADIKMMQKQGTLVGKGGTLKQPWSVTEEGYRVMKISESAMRHGESSLELAHTGRIKDITRTGELYTRLFTDAGRPSSVKPTLEAFKNTLPKIERLPNIMKQEESVFLYSGKNLGEKWSYLKTNLYEKYVPQAYSQKSFMKTMSMEKPFDIKTDATKIIQPKIPPQPTSSSIRFSTYPSSVLSLGFSSSASAIIRQPSVAMSSIRSAFKGSNSISIKSVISGAQSVSANLRKIFTQSTSASASPSKSISVTKSPIAKAFPSAVISPSSYSSSMSRSSITKPPSTIHSMYAKPSSMYGRGTSGFPGGSLDPRYLYREFKLPNIKEILAKVKI